MPKGTLGIKRLTSLGPLTEKTSEDIEPPQFKTKTFGWSTTDLKFSSTGGGFQSTDVIENPGGRGVEAGTSLSLDGTFNDARGYTKDNSQHFITYIYPLDAENDIPFFYLNPFGKKRSMVRTKDVVLESPSFFREAEVAVRNKFNVNKAVGVVINITEEDIEKMAQQAIEDTKFESREKRIERDKEFTIQQINKIKSKFNVLERVPRTEFRNKVSELSQGIRDLNYKDDWKKIERKLRPVHKTVAETYSIDYERLRQKMIERLD